MDERDAIREHRKGLSKSLAIAALTGADRDGARVAFDRAGAAGAHTDATTATER